MIDALTQPVELPLLVVLLLLAYTPQRLVRAIGSVQEIPGALAAASTAASPKQSAGDNGDGDSTEG
jgi:hypothetical protein